MPRKSAFKCYFGCIPYKGTVHHFPPSEYPYSEKFDQWKMVLAEIDRERGDNYIHNNIRICDNHFEEFYRTASGRLTKNAVPTLNIEATFAQGVPKVITNLDTEHNYCIPRMKLAVSSANVGMATPSLKPAAVLAPTNTDSAATQAPQPTLTKLSTSTWQQSIVRNSFRKNPDNDQKETGKAAGSGGSIPTPAGEVRMHQHETALAGERKHGDRAVATEQVRDQARVREGLTQREKRPDAETRDWGRVRDGETQREKSPEALEPTGAVGQNPDRQRRDTKKPPLRSARGKRLRASRGVKLELRNLPGTSKPQPEPSGSGAANREPDDTASPSTLGGNPKRVRTQAVQGEQRTYARATKDIPARLSVVICFPPPSRDLTHTEATYIRTELERLIMETDPTKPLPAFRGYPRVAHGTVQMCCEDENALTWLTMNVPKIRLPETDLTLTVMRQTDVPTRVRAALFVPRYNGDIARLQSILIRQNTWYDIRRWSLYRATSVGGDNHGTYLTLGIPTDEAEKVLGRKRRISYLLGSIYVRFYPKAQPTDVRTDTETVTETTEPTQTNDQDMTRLEEEKACAGRWR